MKQTELYSYIREEIINTLKEAELNIPTPSGTSTDTTSDQKNQAKKASTAGTSVKYIKKGDIKEEGVDEIFGLSKNSESDKIEDIIKHHMETTDLTREQVISLLKKHGTDEIQNILKKNEDKITNSLTEMARTPVKIKLGDPAKVEAVKKLYSGSWKGNMIDAVEAAGEDGISQLDLALAVGKTSQPAINPSVNEFLKIGAFVLNKIAKAEPEASPETEPEVGVKIEPTEIPDKDEDAPEVKDDWEKPEDEETEKEEEPKPEDIKAIEKTVDKDYAKTLSPEDEEKFNRLKKGINTKIKKLKPLTKEKRAESDDMKILKQLIKRDDVKQLFRDKGVDLKDFVADIL